jgi:hypothetical protein
MDSENRIISCAISELLQSPLRAVWGFRSLSRDLVVKKQRLKSLYEIGEPIFMAHKATIRQFDGFLCKPPLQNENTTASNQDYADNHWGSAERIH